MILMYIATDYSYCKSCSILSLISSEKRLNTTPSRHNLIYCLACSPQFFRVFGFPNFYGPIGNRYNYSYTFAKLDLGTKKESNTEQELTYLLKQRPTSFLPARKYRLV